MRKWIIISTLSLCLIIGLWIYGCMSGPGWVGDFTRGTTRNAAQAVGLHVFEEPSERSAQAKKETVANLPDGYYVYVGPRPMQAEPKWVVVNPGGTISWLNKGASVVAPTSTASVGTTKPAVNKVAAATDASQGQFEKYAYPVIKWKVKPLSGTGNPVAQLHTTFEPGAPGEKGTVKYKLTLFHAPGNGSRKVQLMDANGFKLVEFDAGNFMEIPNSELIESNESFPCDENEYRQARDYSVN